MYNNITTTQHNTLQHTVTMVIAYDVTCYHLHIVCHYTYGVSSTIHKMHGIMYVYVVS